MNPRRWVIVARQVAEVIRDHDITFKAGAIAHAAFLSLLPLLLLVFVVAAAVGNDALTEHLTGMAQSHLSPAGEGLVYEALTNASDRAGASLIGVVSLVWGMLRIFRGVATAFDDLYEDGETSFVEKVTDGLVAFAVILVATVGVGVGAAALATVDHPVAELLNPLVLLAGLIVAFFPMYYVFPEPDVSPREAVPGTIVAAIGWVLLEMVFGVYTALVDTVGTYETLGAVILLLIWLYANAFVLLTGAAVNIVLAGRHRSTGAEDRSEESDAGAPVRV